MAKKKHAYSIRRVGKSTHYKIPLYSPAWRQFRTTGIPEYPGGIGSSEVSAICGTGYNEHLCKAAVFHYKVGSMKMPVFDTAATWHGRYDEEKIHDLWQCYDGTEQGYMEIYDNIQFQRSKGIKVDPPRKAMNMNAIVVSDEHKYLFASLDRRMVRGSMNWITGKPVDEPCPLELKTMNGYVGRKWENAMPISYYFQLQEQMLCLKSKYAEVAILEDGRVFRVIPFEFNPDIANRIITDAQRFMHLVFQGRKVYRELLEAENNGRYALMEKKEEEFANLEPPPDNTKAYMEFMTKRAAAINDQAIGDKRQIELARRDKILMGLSNVITDARQEIKNTLFRDSQLLGINVFNMQDLGTVKFYHNKGDSVYTMKNNFKIDVDKELGEKIINAAYNKYLSVSNQ